MSWGLLSDKLYSDPKFLRVPVPARWLFMCIFSWCRDHDTAGYLTREDALAVARYQGVSQRMVDLLKVVPEGYEHPFLRPSGTRLYVHDYEEFARLTAKEIRRKGRPISTEEPPSASAARARAYRARRRDDASRQQPDVTERDESASTYEPAAPARATGAHQDPTLTRTLRVVSRGTNGNPEQDQLPVDPALSMPRNGTDRRQQVDEVFEAWAGAIGKRRQLTPDRRREIEKALKLFPLDDVLDAVRGAALDPFLMGQNDRDRFFGELHVILRPRWLEPLRDAQRQRAEALHKAQLEDREPTPEEKAAARAARQRLHETIQQLHHKEATTTP